MQDIEHRTIRKVSARLIPFLILCYFVAYLDRVNVGFAALTMNKDLGLSAPRIGFGAGVFFLGYFVFEVPSNLFLERFGARKWIARIMLTWGILSGAMAFIPDRAGDRDDSFYVVRVLLGLAEAGFFPGIIFYLTLWFPAVYRARIVGYFMAAIPLSSVIGSPVSGDAARPARRPGLAGWQWLFILEAVPAVILAVVVFFYLTDRPADAAWLAPDERTGSPAGWTQEQRQREAAQHFSVMKALTNPRVLALCAGLFRRGGAQLRRGLLAAADRQRLRPVQLPDRLGHRHPLHRRHIGMVWYGRRSDGKGTQGHAAVALAIAAIGIAGSTALDDPVLKMLAFSIGALRRLRLPAGVLDAADRLPAGAARGRGHRRHQLDRQSLRLLRPLRHGMDQGSHRELHRRTARRRRVRGDRRRHRPGAGP